LARTLVARGLEFPHLFVSGYTSDVFPHGESLTNQTHFLVKPFAIDGLTDKVSTIIGPAQST
jgi:hypothetical protein